MPVAAVVAVAGVFWCRWPGCGWGVLVRVRCPWLGLDRAVAFSGLSRVGAVRMARVSCACPHGVSHGCLHAALHGCLCMLMFQMMTPYKGCIDVTVL